MAWTTPRTWVTDEVVTSSLMNTHVRDNLISVLPIGTFILRAATYTTSETAVESRWLQCNGVAVSRTTYSALLNYLNGLSLPFGAGDGVTTFTLPDLRGRTAWTQGTNSAVYLMGLTENSPGIDYRTPYHRHSADFGGIGGDTTVLGDVAAGGGVAGTINIKSSTTAGLPVDTPGYLVAGSYFIKYTS